MLGLGCWGLAVGPTAALRLGTWGAWPTVALRLGAGPTAARGVCGACVSRETRCLSWGGGRRRRRYLVLKGGGRKGMGTKTDKSSLPYKTPWNFYREGMKLPVFV